MEARAASLTRIPRSDGFLAVEGMATVGKPSFLALAIQLLIKSTPHSLFFIAHDRGMDQIFVVTKQWLLSWSNRCAGMGDPNRFEPDQYCGVLGVFLTLFALVSVLERKILGRIQNRYGPNRVGPFGLFQPVADGIKLLIKEDIVPIRADKVVHFLAPILIAATAILALGVIPYGRNMTPFAIDGGILFFFAVGSTTELGRLHGRLGQQQ